MLYESFTVETMCDVNMDADDVERSRETVSRLRKKNSSLTNDNAQLQVRVS